jgi:hypothetical protein
LIIPWIDWGFTAPDCELFDPNLLEDGATGCEGFLEMEVFAAALALEAAREAAGPLGALEPPPDGLEGAFAAGAAGALFLAAPPPPPPGAEGLEGVLEPPVAPGPDLFTPAGLLATPPPPPPVLAPPKAPLLARLDLVCAAFLAAVCAELGGAGIRTDL